MKRAILGLALSLAGVAAAHAAGPYLADRPHGFLGQSIGPGHCVDYVKAAAGVPHTAAWRPGPPVRGNAAIRPGTAIATFEADGTYASRTGSHAAIYLDQDENGIWVLDQWLGQPVHRRLVRFKGDEGKDGGGKSNNGDLFAVIH